MIKRSGEDGGAGKKCFQFWVFGSAWRSNASGGFLLRHASRKIFRMIFYAITTIVIILHEICSTFKMKQLKDCSPGDGVRIQGEVHQVLSILKEKVQVRGTQSWSAIRLLPADTRCDFICSEKEAAERYFAALQPKTNSFQK
jgi:hypothetical protein